MLKLNDLVEIKITSIANGGEGVGKLNNFIIFVPFSAIGDYLEVKIIELKKTFARARINKILTKSEDRDIAGCEYYFSSEKDKYCGGCNFMHIKYLKQLEYKKNFILDSISRMGKINKINNIDILQYGLEIENSPLEYRNKLQFPLFLSKEDNQIHFGLYVNGTHEINVINSCKVCKHYANKILNSFVFYANKFNLKIYDEKVNPEGFRHVLVRINKNNEVILTVIGTYNYDENNIQIKNLKELSKILFDEYNNSDVKINGIIYSVNSRKTNFILGDKFFILEGKDEIEEKVDTFDGKYIKYKISSSSFFQINTFVMEILYNSVRKLLLNLEIGKLKDLKVLDLFCGSGGIGIFISDLVNSVIGIDVAEKSIENARIISKENSIYNTLYVNKNIERQETLDYILEQKVDILIVNPPRKGINKNIIEVIKKICPSKIFYVSCNPVSLARDIGLLKDKYDLQFLKAFDMFPETSNVETLALLRNGNDYE